MIKNFYDNKLDAPDSICMVASEVIMQNYKFGKVKPIKRVF